MLLLVQLEFTLMVFRYNLMELGTIWWSLGTIQWFLRRIWWFLGTIWWIVGTIWSKGAVSFIFSRSVEKHATNFPSDWKFISSKSVFLTSPTPHMWSLTSLLRYRFWRRVNIPVSIQERFSCLSEFRDVFRQAIGTFESGGALNVMLNLFGLDIFLWINRKKKKHLYFQSLARFQSCCMSCHVATLEVLVCHNMTTYLLIASWLAHHSVWVGAGVLQNSLVFCCWKKHASSFMCAMVNFLICGHKSSTFGS